MRIIENYKDFVGSGAYNNVTSIDDEWVLKSPWKVGEGRHKYKNMKRILKKFDDHIWYMKRYPEVFPKVKKLDKYRAAIEKVNTDKAKEEVEHIYKLLYKYMSKEQLTCEFLSVLYINNLNIREKLLNYPNDAIAIRWYKFISFLQETFDWGPLDIHNDNVGIDKNGNLKLIDF